MKSVVPLMAGLAFAGAAHAQAPAPGPLDRTLEVGGWTVSDIGGRPDDDADRQVNLTRTFQGIEFVLHRSDNDGAGLFIKLARCHGMTVNSGFQLEGDLARRAADVRDEVHDAFKDFAKECPPVAGEEAALMTGFDEADRVLETWVRDRPFTYRQDAPSDPPTPSPK